jgi:hypothetical protein
MQPRQTLISYQAGTTVLNIRVFDFKSVSFCEKYTEKHCHLARDIVSTVAAKSWKA